MTASPRACSADTVGLWRKKPVVIEAWQWHFQREGELRGVCNCHRGNWGSHVHTMHDDQIVALTAGDWIIPEPDGIHYYPCKPEVFANTYEAADAPQPVSVAQAAIDCDEAMARLSASEAACYRWPEETAEHRAMRSAYMDGAAHTVASPAPSSWQPTNDRNAVIEECAKIAEGPLYKEKYRGVEGRNWFHVKQSGLDCAYGNGRHDAAKAIRALALPSTHCGSGK